MRIVVVLVSHCFLSQQLKANLRREMSEEIELYTSFVRTKQNRSIGNEKLNSEIQSKMMTVDVIIQVTAVKIDSLRSEA